ncbi:MAG: endonuclease domain-containing protein [Iamia sp.]
MQPITQRTIAERARQQLGLITRDQLKDLSVSHAAIENLEAVHRLEQMGRDVFRIAGTPRSWEQQVLAACLDTGGIASHRTGARLHPLHGFRLLNMVEVTVTRDRFHGQHPLAIVHTSTNLPPDDIVHIGPIPCTGVARTFLGLAALAPEVPVEDIRAALDVAARDGLVSEAWLWWRLEMLRCRGRDGVSVMEEILRRRQHLGPTESWLEHRFLELLEDHGLPLPTVQRRVRRRGSFVARVDARYDERAIIVELDGYASHSTRVQIDRDERRRNALTLAGNTVLVFTYDHVVQDPAYVLRTVREALSDAAAA